MTNKVKPADVKFDNISDYITFVVHTAKYRTLPTKKFLERKKWEKSSDNNVLAKIPGSIYKIYVKKGAKVKKGAILFELDAMKMYNKILAPHDCIVSNILVEEKQKVSKGALIMELEF